MSAFVPVLLSTCSACGEPIMQNYAGMMEAARAYRLHAKYCTPKKKAASAKAEEEREANGVGRPLARLTYAGRMFLREMEKRQSAKREAEKAKSGGGNELDG